MNEHDYVPIKLHLQKQAVGQFWQSFADPSHKQSTLKEGREIQTRKGVIKPLKL